jgi:putative chitinase
MAFDPKLLFDRLRNGRLLGPTLDTGEVQGVEAILNKSRERGLKAAQVAYILATAYHETAGTMQPIRERGGTGYFTRMYDVRGARPKLARDNGNIYPGDGARFYGRGLAQITWRGNYDRIGKKIGYNLVETPDLALRLDVATIILVDGMRGGWFTGRSLNHYIPMSGRAVLHSFKEARRIINGQDRAALVAGYALKFQDDLIAAGWPL